MQSTQHECTKCNVYLDIEAEYVADEEYGDSVEVTARCPSCGDLRCGTLDDLGIGIRAIAEMVGGD